MSHSHSGDHLTNNDIARHVTHPERQAPAEERHAVEEANDQAARRGDVIRGEAGRDECDATPKIRSDDQGRQVVQRSGRVLFRDGLAKNEDHG